MKFENKYLKYKNKYFTLKNMIGSGKTLDEMPKNILVEDYYKLNPQEKNFYLSEKITKKCEDIDIYVSYYRRLTLDEYTKLQEKQQQALLENNALVAKIFAKTDNITQEEYNLLSPSQQSMYEIVSTKTEGPQYQLFITNTYRKITAGNDIRAKKAGEIFAITRDITEKEYELLLPFQKALYEVASTKSEGPQYQLFITNTYRTITAGNDIRAHTVAKIMEQSKITPREYLQLSPTQKKKYVMFIEHVTLQSGKYFKDEQNEMYKRIY